MRVEVIMAELSLREEDRILDLGCGDGYFLQKLKRGFIVGIDVSRSALDAAKKVSCENTNLVCGIGESLPFRSHCFDKVVCSEVLEHTIRPEEVIKETGRVVEEEGSVLVSIPNERLINWLKRGLMKLGLFKRLFGGIPPRMDSEWHLHIFDLQTAKRLINLRFSLTKVIAVPSIIIPIGYVMSCRLP